MEPDIDIRATRLQSLKMTQTELADALGVNLSTIWRWEKNIVPTPLWAKKAVARIPQPSQSASEA